MLVTLLAFLKSTPFIGQLFSKLESYLGLAVAYKEGESEQQKSDAVQEVKDSNEANQVASNVVQLPDANLDKLLQ